MGRVSDHIVVKWRRKRKGVWYPEDRLRATIASLAVIIPISLLAFGLVNKFVDGDLGLVLSLFCLFFNGGGVSGQALLCNQILQKRADLLMIYITSLGGHDLHHLRGVSGRCDTVPKFRSFGSN